MISAPDLTGMVGQLGHLMSHVVLIDNETSSGVDADGQPIATPTETIPIQAFVEEQPAILGRDRQWLLGPGADPQIVNALIFLPVGTAIKELDIIHRIDVTPERTYQTVYVRREAIPIVLVVEARRLPL